jgi:drug/metabolite transporter (DMT)-like permease
LAAGVLGLVLALASSACWGVSDFIGGLQSRRVPVLRVVYVSQAAGLVLLGLILAARGVAVPAPGRLWQAGLGGLAGAAGLAAFYQGLAIGSMSIVAPIAATGVSIPVIAGILGGERPAAPQVAGIAAAVIGVLLASREQHPGRAHAVVPRRAPLEVSKRSPAAGRSAARTSVALALASAAGFGCFFLGLRASARADPLWATCAARVVSVAALTAVAARSRGTFRGRADARAWCALAVVGILDVGANVLYAMATRHGLLSIVSVMASLYPLGTVGLARVLLGERVGRLQEAGVVAALTGVLLMAAG